MQTHVTQITKQAGKINHKIINTVARGCSMEIVWNKHFSIFPNAQHQPDTSKNYKKLCESAITLSQKLSNMPIPSPMISIQII